MAITVALVVASIWIRGQFFDQAALETLASIPSASDGAADGGLTTFYGGDAHAQWPPVPQDARDKPLGHSPASRSSSTEYRFEETIGAGNNSPVRFDPCRPIHVVVNSQSAAPGGDALVQSAMNEIERSTGLRFVVDGATSELPSKARPAIDPPRYGSRWSPVLVAWTDPGRVPELSGSVIGLGGPASAPYTSDREKHWVSGTVYLDAPEFAEVLKRPQGQGAARAIVMHEFGHLVGLDHVEDPSQLMYPEHTTQMSFGLGDLEGLRRLGDGPCFS